MNYKTQIYDSMFNATQNQTVDLFEVINGIYEGNYNGIQYSSMFDAIRSLNVDEYNKINQKVNELKLKLPMFVSAVNCTTRRTEEITSFTGLMTLDIDYGFRELSYEQLHEQKKYLFDNEEHVVCAFLSPVKGIKLIIYLGNDVNNVDEYGNLFDSIAQYYLNKHNVTIDKSGRDAVRGCYFSYDPEIQIRFQPVAYMQSVVDLVYETQIEENSISTDNNNDKKSESTNYCTDANAAINDFYHEIINLKIRDEQKLIISKHQEMLRIQMQAISYMRKNNLDETFVYETLNEAWKSLYPTDRLKRESFAKAWVGGTMLHDKNIESVGKIGCNYSDVAFTFERYQKAKSQSSNQELLALKIDGNIYPFLKRTRYSCIVALPGCGKSSIVESICSKVINPESMGLHFELGESVKKVLVIDTENVDSEISLTIERISKRTNISIEDIISNHKLTFISTKEMEIRNDAKFNIYEYLEYVFINEHYDIIVIDDVSEVVNDSDEGVNSIVASKRASQFFTRFATKHNCGFFFTIHSNSQQSMGKGRGHLGSELERFAMSVLHLIPNQDGFSIVGSSMSAKMKSGGLNDLKRNPLHYLYDNDCGYMREMNDHEANEYGITRNRIAQNKKLLMEMQQYVEDNINKIGKIPRKDIYSHIENLHPGLTDDKFDNLFKDFKKANKSTFEVLKDGRYSYIKVKENSIVI